MSCLIPPTFIALNSAIKISIKTSTSQLHMNTIVFGLMEATLLHAHAGKINYFHRFRSAQLWHLYAAAGQSDAFGFIKS